MSNNYKAKTVEREQGFELKKLPPPIVKECFTGWNPYEIFLVVVKILRNQKSYQFKEVLYKERGRDIHKDKDLTPKIIREFDIGSKDVYEIKSFHKLKSLGNGYKD